MIRTYFERDGEHPGVVEMYRNLHEMILRMAGRLSDSSLAKMHEAMMEGDWQQAGVLLENVAIGYKVMLPTEDMTQLPRRVTEPGWKTNRPLPTGDFESVLPLKNYTFTPFPPKHLNELPANWLDLLDISGGEPSITSKQLYELFGWYRSPLTTGLTPDHGVVGIWQTWRSGPDVDSPVKRVHVVELDPKADPSAYTRDAFYQLRGTSMGDKEPLIEAYLSGWTLPEYQRRAQAGATLIWARKPGPVHLIAESGGRAGAQVPGTGYSTDGLVVWPGPANGELSTVEDVDRFRALLTLRKAGVVS